MNYEQLTQEEQLIITWLKEEKCAMNLWKIYKMIETKSKGACPSPPTLIKAVKLLWACKFLSRRKVRGRFYYYPKQNKGEPPNEREDSKPPNINAPLIG